MIRQENGLPILVKILVFAVALAGTGEAWAGGIIIKASGGTVAGTDPFYYYEFDVSLAAGYQWFANDYFTIECLPGITPPNPPLGESGNNPNLPSPGSASSYTGTYNFGSPIITLTDSSSPFASNVEWLNTTGTTITAGASALSLGSFIVYTSVSLTSLPPTVTYIAQSHDSQGNVYIQGPGGNTPPVMIELTSVPEPASVVLFLSATGLLSLFLLRQRRRLSGSLQHPA